MGADRCFACGSYFDVCKRLASMGFEVSELHEAVADIEKYRGIDLQLAKLIIAIFLSEGKPN